MRHNHRRRFEIPPAADPPEGLDPDAARYAGDSAAAVVRDALDLLANRPPFDRLTDAEWREQAGKLVGAAMATRPPPDLTGADDDLLADFRANPHKWCWAGDPVELQAAAEREIERRVTAEHEAAA